MLVSQKNNNKITKQHLKSRDRQRRALSCLGTFYDCGCTIPSPQRLNVELMLTHGSIILWGDIPELALLTRHRISLRAPGSIHGIIQAGDCWSKLSYLTHPTFRLKTSRQRSNKRPFVTLIGYPKLLTQTPHLWISISLDDRNTTSVRV